MAHVYQKKKKNYYKILNVFKKILLLLMALFKINNQVIKNKLQKNYEKLISAKKNLYF